MAARGQGGSVIEWLLGGAVIVFMVLLAIGAITGRVKARSCCSAVDPEHDRRMTETPQDSRTTAP